ncbi:MAG: hypothetical protein IJM63_11410 [Solobacterium sp.]|nr:hypothetical protein [Solobacterium sp.]
MTTVEDRKQKHLDQAADILKQLYKHMDNIRSAAVIRKIEQLIDRIKDLRDTQYLFDSGEYELDRLYERYLPYMLAVIGNYADIEETGHDPEEVERVRKKLIKGIDTMIDAILNIRDILPQDEISSARAEAEAKKRKEELDAMFPRIDVIKLNDD